MSKYLDDYDLGDPIHIEDLGGEVSGYYYGLDRDEDGVWYLLIRGEEGAVTCVCTQYVVSYG